MEFHNILLETAATASAAATSSGAAKTGGTTSTLFMIGYIVIIVGAMYFLLIRPQKKKQKKEDAMRNNIQVGDEIITIGGIYGRIMSVKEDSFVIESLGDHSKQRIAKWSIQQNLTIHDDTPSK